MTQTDFFAQLLPILYPLILAIVGLVSTLIVAKVADIRKSIAAKSGIDLENDTKQREWMDKLLQLGIDYAVNRQKSTTASDAFVKTAVSYVQDKGPDVIKYFQLNADKIAEMILVRAQARPDIDTGVESKPPVTNPTLVLPNLEVASPDTKVITVPTT